MKLLDPILPKTFDQLVTKWLNPIKHGESVAVVSAPLMDRYRRFNQLMINPSLIKKYLGYRKHYDFFSLEHNVFSSPDEEDFLISILNQYNHLFPQKPYYSFAELVNDLDKDSNHIIVIVIQLAEQYLNDKGKIIFSFLSELLETHPCFRVMLFFEADILDESNRFYLGPKTTLMQNIVYHELYSKENIEQFIKYLAQKWVMEIPQELIEQIYEQCGGYLLLVKQAIRCYRKNNKVNFSSIFDHQSIQDRIGWLLDGLSREMVSSLQNLAEEAVDLEELKSKDNWRYLQQVGLVRQDGSFGIALLKSYLLKNKNNNLNLKVRAGEILLNDLPINHYFSRQEYRVLRIFLLSDKLVSRDEVAYAIWQNEVQARYSEWAIDQLIKRLRNKLIELGFAKRFIKTLRGKGYVLAKGN